MTSRNAAIYDRWFQFADQDKDLRVTGKDAVAFFEKSELPREILFKVWEMANSTKQGFLDRIAFHKAMDLIALGQLGYEITKENYAMVLERDGGLPLPQLAGFNEEGNPDGTQPFTVPAPAAPSTASFMTAAKFTTTEDVTKPSGWGKKMVDNLTGQGAGGKKPLPAKLCTSITDGLKAIYFQKVKPIEEAFKFQNFFSALMVRVKV